MIWPKKMYISPKEFKVANIAAFLIANEKDSFAASQNPTSK